MTSIAEGLFKSLPKPKYTGEEEQLPQHAQPRGPRVVGADQIDETQVVLRVSTFILNYLFNSEKYLLGIENRPPSIRKPNRMAPSLSRRLRRRWRVPRDPSRPIPPRHGP